jgi:hypothetical protein
MTSALDASTPPPHRRSATATAGQQRLRSTTGAGATPRLSPDHTLLRPPAPHDLGRIVTEPTRLSGVRPAAEAPQATHGAAASSPASRPLDPSIGTAPARTDSPPPAFLDRSQRDALFQALADELEQATAELGIGSEA